MSIVTATFNAAATVRACMQSVQAQSYPRIEHLLIDGASTDNTVATIAANSDGRTHWISEPDRGIYDAWNKGLRMATGEWIAFLGADDVYLPDAVQAYMDLARSTPEACYLSSQVRLVRKSGRSRIIGQPWTWPRFRRYMCTAHVGSMHRRDLFQQYGTYNDALRIVADYEMLLRAGSHLHAAFLPQLTAEMSAGGASESVAAMQEAARVKRTTGGRGGLATELERLGALGGYALRHFAYRFF